MNILKTDFLKNNIEHKATVESFESSDFDTLNTIYFDWKNLNNKITSLNSRRIALPEILSEGLSCILFDLKRVNGKNKTTLKNNSFDCIDLKNGNTYQIKAVSTETFEEYGGPTSFGPKSEYDKLLLLHFVLGQDNVYIYSFDNDLESIMVNSKETFKDQCDQGRRPRFSLLKEIKNLKIEPIQMFKWRT